MIGRMEAIRLTKILTKSEKLRLRGGESHHLEKCQVQDYGCVNFRLVDLCINLCKLYFEYYFI